MQIPKSPARMSFCRRRDAACRMQNAECRLQISCELHIGAQTRSRDVAARRAAECRLQNANRSLHTERGRMQKGCRLQNAECKSQPAHGEREELHSEHLSPPLTCMYKTKDRYVYFTFYPDPPIPERSCRMQISECKSDLQCCIHDDENPLALSSTEVRRERGPQRVI